MSMSMDEPLSLYRAFAFTRPSFRGHCVTDEDGKAKRQPAIVEGDRSAAHAPHTITLDCDIILRGSTRRLLTPEKIARRPKP